MWPLLVALPALGALGLVGFAGLTARRVGRAVPPAGRFVEVAGCRLHYLDQGSGPPIVMVHGLGASMHHFSHGMLELLADEFRVVLVERPGSGHSVGPPGRRANPRAQGDVIAAFIEALGLERPVIAGHSLGGCVALAVGLDHPRLVSGLALLAPLTEAQSETPELFRGLVIRSAAARRLMAWTLATPAAIRGGPETMRVAFSPEAPPADWALRGGGLLGLRPSAFEAASADLVAIEQDLPAMMARYGGLEVPVGILFGRDDAILDARANTEGAIAAAPRLDVRLIDGAGHMIPVTRPRECADWLRAHARAWHAA